MEQRFGHAVKDHLETLENSLSKTHLDEQETASTERALDKLNWFSKDSRPRHFSISFKICIMNLIYEKRIFP